MLDAVVIGCGIVGAAVAYELSRYSLDVAVLEKENDVAEGTTKANSAVLHAGYDPLPGTLMAKLNVEGAALAKSICEKLDVPYRQVGSLVLAFSDEDLTALTALYRQGVKNGVSSLALIDAKQLHELEEHVAPSAVGALYAPSAAIVSPWEYTLALIETAVRNGAHLYLNHKVTAIRRVEGGYEITAAGSVYRTKYVLNAAGISADIIHNLVAPPAFIIQPNRGEYYLLDKSEGVRVNHVIFQCPSSEGKGVLVAPTVHGNLIVGPNAEDVIGNDVANTPAGLAFVAKMAQKSIPSVRLKDSIRNFAGARALTETDDFLIREAEGAPGFFDLAGIKSPGLTAAPAIAKLAVRLLAESGVTLSEKESFIDTRKKLRFKNLSTSEKTALVAKHPAYGHVICRCEVVTEGEILDALDSPIPPCSIDGVKRRCGAGMGRCQGGFCGPGVLKILARELRLDPTQILQDRAGTVVLTGETKEGEAHV